MEGENSTSAPQQATTDDEAHPKTLYVGNLDRQVTTSFLECIFSPIGPIKSCKIIDDGNSDPYAFVEFWDHEHAKIALRSMNGRNCFDKEIKVSWGMAFDNESKVDTSQHFHVFVGDLDPSVGNRALRAAFAQYGEISDCKVVKDPHTFDSKGYGFVVFVNKVDAEAAINGMNGQFIGSRRVRTNWAIRKSPGSTPNRSDRSSSTRGNLPYHMIYNQTGPTNSTIYCGGGFNGLTEELLRQLFSPFGNIRDIRIFAGKGYAFIRFGSKDSATKAIVAMRNKKIDGQTLKCSWGKEMGPPHSASGAGAAAAYMPTQQYGYGYYTPTQYPYYYGQTWYPYPHQSYSTTPIAPHVNTQFQPRRSRSREPRVQSQNGLQTAETSSWDHQTASRVNGAAAPAAAATTEWATTPAWNYWTNEYYRSTTAPSAPVSGGAN